MVRPYDRPYNIPVKQARTVSEAATKVATI